MLVKSGMEGLSQVENEKLQVWVNVNEGGRYPNELIEIHADDQVAKAPPTATDCGRRQLANSRQRR